MGMKPDKSTYKASLHDLLLLLKFPRIRASELHVMFCFAHRGREFSQLEVLPERLSGFGTAAKV